jgi:hypothetical protein
MGAADGQGLRPGSRGFWPRGAFVCAEAELAVSADYEPFQQAEIAGAEALNIVFLAGPPDDQSAQKLMTLRTQIDD